MIRDDHLGKLIKLTGERARLDAKANGTYVVYKDKHGKMIREYSNGAKEYISGKDD